MHDIDFISLKFSSLFHLDYKITNSVTPHQNRITSLGATVDHKYRLLLLQSKPILLALPESVKTIIRKWKSYGALCIVLLDKEEVRSFLLRGSYNIELKDDAVYNMTESVNDDYGMMDGRPAGHRDLDNKRNQYQVDKLASKMYNNLKTSHPGVKIVTATNRVVISDQPHIPKRKDPKRKAIKDYDDRDYSLYDYYELVDEYDKETSMETKSNKTYHPSKIDDSKTDIVRSLKSLFTFDTQTKNCTAEEIHQIGFKAIYCLYSDYKHDRQNPRVLAARLWRIARIWFYVYLVVAIPFWCTNGWCCCCLFCKFFRPRQTIEEAKRYLASSPPGVLHTRRGGQTYEPTEREIERYEEFEHFIQTV